MNKKKIEKLYDKKNKLEMNLFTVDFDMQFRIKKKIEEIEDKIDRLESCGSDYLNSIDIVIEIVKGHYIHSEKIPFYVGYTNDLDENRVVLWSDIKLYQGQNIKAEALGYIEELSEKTIICSTGPNVNDEDVEEAREILLLL